MTKENAEKLLYTINKICDVDSFAGCSDLYFRQIMTLRLKSLKGMPSYEALKAEAEKEETKPTKKKG